MRSAIVSIGSELIDGFVTDTNATFLAQEMTALGIQLMSVQQVGDDLDRIVLTLKRAWEDGEIIVTTGGIGPTGDDLTRESIAALLNETVSVDQGLLDQISGFFSSRGIPMPERNTKQAWLIPSASALPNPMGTAPGWFVEHDGHYIVTMPGVPREMRRMWSEQAVPRLLPALGDRAVESITLKTLGLGESAAEREIIHLVERGYPIVATYAKDDGVHIRITAAANTHEAASSAVNATAAEIRSIIGSYVYGDVSLSLAAAIVEPLRERGLSLAVFEAGSGGRITEMLAEEPAAAGCF
ncbi:MAG TPA: molybdopterin-binding protein, partial [Thermomicrobiaceae bacterium]|nr:molybdopterin-binding protein [Thermomicrobiaceae bacterium]